MKMDFIIKDDGTIPVVHIDGVPLSIVSLTYAWSTKTDQVGSGANICIADGYLGSSLILRRFLFNIFIGTISEVPMEAAMDANRRTFEVCVDSGSGSEMEKWEERAFLDLKVDDVIRIKDAGRYYRDLEGNGLWTVTNTDKLQKGYIDVQPLFPVESEAGHGGFLPETEKPD